jgi:hypothetical protein
MLSPHSMSSTILDRGYCIIAITVRYRYTNLNGRHYYNYSTKDPPDHELKLKTL